jgi:aryl-alcohol dehydrogenase-like predicted oxidoreductase
MPNTNRDPIPLRQFGRHEVKISARGSVDIIWAMRPTRALRCASFGRRWMAVFTFFDNCWEYHRGKTEVWMSAGLKGVRDRVFLMTKVCTHGRDKAPALRMLDESMHRFQTDHLDLLADPRRLLR